MLDVLPATFVMMDTLSTLSGDKRNLSVMGMVYGTEMSLRLLWSVYVSLIVYVYEIVNLYLAIQLLDYDPKLVMNML